eukprot:scaffold312647_cov19-Tisochrysis_lutea.AAC.1
MRACARSWKLTFRDSSKSEWTRVPHPAFPSAALPTQQPLCSSLHSSNVREEHMQGQAAEGQAGSGSMLRRMGSSR